MHRLGDNDNMSAVKIRNKYVTSVPLHARGLWR